MRQFKTRINNLPTLIFVATNLLLKFLLYFGDSRIRLFSDSGTYIAAALSWRSWNHLAFFRDRTTFFTFFWAPFIKSDNAPNLIIIAQILLTVFSGTVSYLIFQKVFHKTIILFLFFTLLIQSPIYYYYERIILPELLGINISLIFICLLIFIISKKNVKKNLLLFFVGFGLILFSVMVKTNLLLIYLGLIFAFLIYLKSDWELNYRIKVINFASLLSGGFLGIILGTIIFGASTHTSKINYLESSRAMSSYNLIFKFGSIINCNDSFNFEISEIAKSLCLLRNPVVSKRNFDEIMWSEEIIRDWGQSTQPDFIEKAKSYRKLANVLILSNPLKAFFVVVQDGKIILNPGNAPRFTTSPYPNDVWLSINPEINLPQFYESDESDFLYQITIWQSWLRLGIILILVLYILYELVIYNKIDSQVLLLLNIWLIYLILILIFSYPSPRYLVYSDLMLYLSFLIFLLKIKDRRKKVFISK